MIPCLPARADTVAAGGAPKPATGPRRRVISFRPPRLDMTLIEAISRPTLSIKVVRMA